jgi:hypothetical protein
MLENDYMLGYVHNILFVMTFPEHLNIGVKIATITQLNQCVAKKY